MSDALRDSSPHVRAAAVDAIAKRGEHDALVTHARRLHIHLSPVELDRLVAAAQSSAAGELGQLIERIVAVRRDPGRAVYALRAIGRIDFSIDAWLSFADGRATPRSASPDGTAALLIECIREQNEARAADVVKLMNELRASQVTVLVWTSIGLALGLPRVSEGAVSLAQRWLADDGAIVPARGYIWLGQRLRAARADATLAFERAKWLREPNAEAALSDELLRQAWRRRNEGDVRGALALVRRATAPGVALRT
jgi:hypothetical protein